MKHLAKATIAAAVLTALLLGGQGTAALWRDGENIQAGEVTTGNLRLLAGNGAPGQISYAFTALNTTSLTPGGFTQAPLTISNGGNSPLMYVLSSAHAGAATAPADTAIAQAAVLSLFAVTNSAQCSGAGDSPGTLLYQGALVAASTTVARPLATQGSSASEALCVRLSLPRDAPQSASGGNLALTLTFTGEQK